LAKIDINHQRSVDSIFSPIVKYMTRSISLFQGGLIF